MLAKLPKLRAALAFAAYFAATNTASAVPFETVAQAYAFGQVLEDRGEKVLSAASIKPDLSSAYASASLASAAIRTSAKAVVYELAPPYDQANGLGASAYGYMQDILRFDTGLSASATVDVLTHMSAQIQGDGAYTLGWSLTQCPDSTCDNGTGPFVQIARFDKSTSATIDANYSWLAETGSALTLEGGAYYLFTMTVLANAFYIDGVSEVSSLNTSAFDFVLPEGVSFTSLSEAFLTQEASVPTPATLALLGIGLAGLCIARRRKA